jgi:hypothetical protein
VVSNIPTLVITGEYDPTTPPRFAKQVAQNLNRSHLFEFPGQGHSPSLSTPGDCPLNIMLAFLSNPTLKPNSACIARLGEPQFVVPLKSTQGIEFRSFTSDENGIRGKIPSSWTDIGLGCYNRNLYALDPTRLCVQVSATSTEEWLQWLTQKFEGAGLEQAPKSVGERKANGLVWKLYVAEFQGNPVDLALAENGTQTLLVTLVSDSEEHDAMYKAVYLPVIDALVPVR